MRFLHTADWQIGMKASALGSVAARVREERLDAGRRAIEIAKAQAVNFIVVAGDTFEDNAVDRILVQKVADILESFGGPVYIISGNHDPLVPGSVWEHPAWKSSKNLELLRDCSPVMIPGGVLYPCPLFEKNSSRNPVAWIPSEESDQIRIGVAHGTVEGVRQDEPDYPIPRDAAQRKRLDYLALGHWHSYASYMNADGIPRMAYSGSHETTKFGERDSGNVLVIDIAGAGQPPRITPCRTGGLHWVSESTELIASGDLARVRQKIEGHSNSPETIIEIILSGVLMADDRADLEHLEQIVASRFLFGRVDSERLLPSPEDDMWISGLPPGVIRESAIRLRDSRDLPPRTAARALMELFAIAGESKP